MKLVQVSGATVYFWRKKVSSVFVPQNSFFIPRCWHSFLICFRVIICKLMNGFFTQLITHIGSFLDISCQFLLFFSRKHLTWRKIFFTFIKRILWLVFKFHHFPLQGSELNAIYFYSGSIWAQTKERFNRGFYFQWIYFRSRLTNFTLWHFHWKMRNYRFEWGKKTLKNNSVRYSMVHV